MAQTWKQYQTVELTKSEEEFVEAYGLDGSVTRNGKEIVLLAEDDTQCLWGIPVTRGGDVVAVEAGNLYQYCVRDRHGRNYGDTLDAICERYGLGRINDDYAQTIVVILPCNQNLRRNAIRVLNRMERRFQALF